MDTRKKGMLTFSAVALTLMMGLTGCGSDLASQTDKRMEEKAVSGSEMDKEATTSESDEMADEMIPESGSVGMTDEGMPETEGDGMAETKSEEDMMSVTYEKNFELMDLENNTVTLNDYAGKKVYVKFWGTWCSICLAGIDELESFAAEQNAGDDIAVITIVAPGFNGEFSADDFKKWYEKQGHTFPVLLDEGGKVLKEFGIRAFPTSIIFEKDDKISTTRPGHIGNEDLKTLLNINQ